jgi:transposase
VNEYDGRQFVGIDLHRRRTVIVRQSETGEQLGSTRIVNDPAALAREVGKAGVEPEVVLEATYGWYWAADVLAEVGARVHLAHPLGIKGFTYRRVKNDVRDAADLADLLRMGRLPEAWIAPQPVRELRELVRHRAKLVMTRSGFKAGVHAVLAKQGLHLQVQDLFGPAGRAELAAAPLDRAYRARVNAYLRIVDTLDTEIDLAGGWIAARLATDPGYRVIQQIPGVGPIWAAVFVAEIGDVHRFASARHLCSWAGLTPRHRESDTTVHRGPITKMGCGGRGGGFRSRVAESVGGHDAGRGWHRYSSSPADVRLRGSRLRRGGARPDRPGQSGTAAPLAGAVRRPGSGGVRAGGLHGLAVCRRGAGPGGDHRACRRAGRDRGPARPEAAGQDRPQRRPAAA